MAMLLALLMTTLTMQEESLHIPILSLTSSTLVIVRMLLGCPPGLPSTVRPEQLLA